MKCRIAVITDIHFSRSPLALASRQGVWGAVLLRRTVERLNRYIKPDVTVVLGDLLDEPQAADAPALLTELRTILERLTCPWLVIPGNHDPNELAFYEIFKRVESLEVNGVRLVSFVDEEQPGHNARRTPAGLAQMAVTHTGPLVALQHVPVGVPRQETPYGYTNFEEVAAAMRRHGYRLALSGHYHKGRPLQTVEGISTMTVPALCEAPFSFALVTIDGDDVKAEVLSNQLPASLQLNDYHSHTQFAYCAEDVSMERSSAFAKIVGLNQLAFTEHSGQLYFEKKPYWQCRFGPCGIHETEGRRERVTDYWREVTPYRSDCLLTGLEIDADYHGNLVAQPADIERADIVVGAVHWLPALQEPERNLDRAVDEFLRITDRLCRQDIDVLAHPFRVFLRSGRKAPASLYAPVIAILRETGVAAEINFHSNEPEPEFFDACIRTGVKISFGGDAHALYEVGEFHPHLALLEEIGFEGDVHDILVPSVR